MKVFAMMPCALIAGCCNLGNPGSAPPATSEPAQAWLSASHASLPLLTAWADGKLVRYITTDASHVAAAQKMQAHFVPQLANALPPDPRPPGHPSTLARVYEVSNFKQHNVFSSVPQPSGHANHNTDYSPLWRVHMVHWLPGHSARLLNSEEAILAAEEKKEVRIEQTGIVVNCPVLFSLPGGALPGSSPSGGSHSP